MTDASVQVALRCPNCGPFEKGAKVMGHEIQVGDHCYYCNAILHGAAYTAPIANVVEGSDG